MADTPGAEAYRIHVWIRQISPMIWRWLLVVSDSSIADLHHTLQIAFGWSDSHLHRFHIHGRDYGIGKIGGIGFSTDAKQVRLADFRFRINERFLYEYDFGDTWQHEVRIEESAAGRYRRLSSLHWRPSPSAPGRLRRFLGIHGAAA
jgi:hypothetical protein